jgi:hypothetical protein
MKRIIFLLLFVPIGLFSQKKEDIVLKSTNNKQETKKLIIFNINGESFRYKKNIHKKRKILFKEIKSNIVDLKTLKNKTKEKLGKTRSKKEFIPMYYHKFHNIYIYDEICNNKGFIYEVEFILIIDEKEID